MTQSIDLKPQWTNDSFTIYKDGKVALTLVNSELSSEEDAENMRIVYGALTVDQQAVRDALEAWQRINKYTQEKGGFMAWSDTTEDMVTIKSCLEGMLR